MAKISLKAGTTSKLLDIFIQDSSVTTGAGLTGLTSGSSGLTAYYYREGAGSATAISLTSMTLGTWTSAGFIVIDGTNMPGAYQLGIPDAAIASGAKSVLVMLKGATNMAPCLLEIELTATDNQDATRGGMTALPNANAEASGGLYTRGSGAGQINQSNNGEVDVNTHRVSGTTQTARDLGASVLLSVGTGTGQVNLSTGAVPITSNVKKNTALTTFEFCMRDTAGQLKTGLTVSAQRSIDGGAFATGTITNIAEISNGFYKLDFGAGDLNGNVIGVRLTATGAQDTVITIITAP